jgi:hypothetical protein
MRAKAKSMGRGQENSSNIPYPSDSTSSNIWYLAVFCRGEEHRREEREEGKRRGGRSES